MRSCLLALIVLTLSPALRADVLTVGPGGDFAEIQAALDVALDGDIVLVASGTYGPLSVGDLGVSVVADTGATVVIDGGITVSGLSAGRTLALIGLDVVMDGVLGPDDRPALIFSDNSGSLRVEQCDVRGQDGFFPVAYEAALVSDCADVAFARCTLTGVGDSGLTFGSGTLAPPPGALSAQGSQVTLHGGSVTGNSGGYASVFGSPVPRDGGPGVELASGTLFVSGTTITGGQGGPGVADCEGFGGWSGADGGPGVQLVGAGAQLRRLDATPVGGPGGPGAVGSPEIFCFGTSDGDAGPAFDVQSGLDVVIPGASHGLTLPSPARELEPLTMTLQGQPGELAGAFWGLGTTSFFKLGLRGQVLLDFGGFTSLIIVGNVPGSGELSVPFAFDDLGPGWEGLTIHFQSIFGGVDGTYLAAPLAAVIIDEAL